MSEMRKSLENGARVSTVIPKILKGFGWFFIVFGGLLAVTIIGIPLGLFLIFCGVLTLWAAKFVQRTMTANIAAVSEGIEIAEHQLKQARSDKSP